MDAPIDSPEGGSGRGESPNLQHDDSDAATAGLWVKVAGGRLAVQYLERAGEWAADVDQGVVDELEQIRLRLLVRLSKLEELSGAETGPQDDGEPDG